MRNSVIQPLRSGGPNRRPRKEPSRWTLVRSEAMVVTTASVASVVNLVTWRRSAGRRTARARRVTKVVVKDLRRLLQKTQGKAVTCLRSSVAGVASPGMWHGFHLASTLLSSNILYSTLFYSTLVYYIALYSNPLCSTLLHSTLHNQLNPNTPPPPTPQRATMNFLSLCLPV